MPAFAGMTGNGLELSVACLMTFLAGAARRNRWERVAALSSAGEGRIVKLLTV